MTTIKKPTLIINRVMVNILTNIVLETMKVINMYTRIVMTITTSTDAGTVMIITTNTDARTVMIITTNIDAGTVMIITTNTNTKIMITMSQINTMILLIKILINHYLYEKKIKTKIIYYKKYCQLLSKKVFTYIYIFFLVLIK